jgi:glycosyltransferase involved in cell wall biosynthesis
MTALRITIVTFAWPPRNSIGAHRPLSWAKYWSNAGMNVRILTAEKYGYDAPLDLEVPELPGVEVIEVDYATGSTSLAARVLQSPLSGIARKVYRALRGGAGIVRNPREKWLDAALLAANDLARDTDVVVSTYDPRAVHEIASAMKKGNPDLIWVADYRDLWSLNHAPSWNTEQRARERETELRTVASRADMVCSISEELSRQQGEFVGKPWVCITNGFDVDLQDIQTALAPPRRRPTGSLNIVYTGKLYPGLRDPSPLFEVIANMEKNGEISQGEIAVNIFGGQVDGLEEIMKSGRFSHFVTVHGHVKREIALSEQRKADLLLLLESPLPEARGVLTGKIFEYMSAGVPILSLGSRNDSAIGEVLATTSTGACTEDDPEAIQQILRDILVGRTPGWFAPKLDIIGGYSREAQAKKLLDRITELFDHRNNRN